MKGIVLFYDRRKGWGFIGDPNSDADYFVHRTALMGKKCLLEDQEVEFEIGEHNGKPLAVNVRVIETATPAARENADGKH